MSDSEKQDCKYGAKCYRKNPDHLASYNHPAKKDKLEVSCSDESSRDSVSPNRTPKKRKLSPRPRASPPKQDEEKVESKNHSKEVGDMDTNKNPAQQITYFNEAKAAGSSDKSETRKELCTEYERKEVMKLASKNFFVDLEKRLFESFVDEYKEMLKSYDTFISNKFLVEMPVDFYLFWEFCKSMTKNDGKPELVFSDYGIKLVGPFDVLAGKFENAKMQEPADYLRHWRFFFDPPEFQTVFVKSNTCIHYGYWRDQPADKEELLMARNDSNKNCEFEFVGSNCFETILYALGNDANTSPFNRNTLASLIKSIQTFAQEKNITVYNLENVKKKRDRKVVCKAFHKAGIVVPYERKTQTGYRNLIQSDAELKKIFKKFEMAKGDKQIISAAMEQLQPVITAANIAVDECDFGTTLELGIALFCSGIQELHDVLRHLLVTGYSLLGRPQFIAILKSHLEKRSQGSNLSVLC